MLFPGRRCGRRFRRGRRGRARLALAGIGGIAVPGVGPLVATGPIVAALAGAGAAGAVAGIAGALTGMGIPEYEAKRFRGPYQGRRHFAIGSLG